MKETIGGGITVWSEILIQGLLMDEINLEKKYK